METNKPCAQITAVNLFVQVLSFIWWSGWWRR